MSTLYLVQGNELSGTIHNVSVTQFKRLEKHPKNFVFGQKKTPIKILVRVPLPTWTFPQLFHARRFARNFRTKMKLSKFPVKGLKTS